MDKPTPPPECQTEAEKTAFAFGWFKAMETVAQSQHEPVAWMTIDECGEEDDIWYENPEGHLIAGWTYKPLYTSRRPWVGLTEQEVIDCWPGIMLHPDCAEFWKNIEAKLKENNA